ncbi:hypothetical protein FEZ18_06300 [Oceanihabitans sp. IOP_32]|uniref:polysialyltransferase family glycosyltransferase n=1 Tax=Oceanihabitans sp. IOP_32 TaxID=2529032 RepID=UPI001293B89B|nr:polysialyltransferase family glycosyltransferase [Oceanihabitans sp. IOP_32]QFZ54432.1 hypothetical protein FEZ18_06300 [Oceanihabitans sp. IOP_32]
MHVFYIHSHITFVIAQLFILEYNLSKNKIRYITSRGYKLKSNEDSYDMTEFYNYLETESRLNKVFKLKEKIEHLDNGIKLLTDNKPFCAYLPQFNHSLFQIIGTHDLCESLVLVEEGITAYKLDKELYKSTKIKCSQFLSKLISKRFLLKNKHYQPYPKDKFKYAICINKDCFPFIEEKKVLKINSQIVTNYNNTIENGNVVFVLDSFKERTKISEEEYLMIIKETLKLLKTYDNQLFIKFHPEQNELIRKKTLSFVINNFGFDSITCLKDSCILEFEFLKSKNLTVIGMHTSLLYYAKRFDHHVLSGIKLTSGIPEIDTYINHIMDMEQKKEYMSYV